MRADVAIPYSALFGFALVLTRMAGVFTFVPLPGAQAGPSLPRIILAVSTALALSSRWPPVDSSALTPALLASLILAEAAIGILIGLAVGVVSDTFAMAAQIMSLQSGYSYASTIDPTSQADSQVLVIAAQLLAGLLFFAVGLDRVVIRSLAVSLDTLPPGTLVATRGVSEIVVNLLATIFSTGLRIALPVVALLAMVDIALALLGRISAQVQVVTLTFPIKMLLGLFILAALMVSFPKLYESTASQALATVHQAVAR
jgi:flagellar biosynthetic protein FliR